MNVKKSLRDFENAEKRRQYLEKELNITLNPINHFSFKEDQVVGRNIENLIGSIQIPLGVAGPVTIKNSNYKNSYIPVATTEGALTASLHRGLKAITLSGGATVETTNTGVTRSPLFRTKSITHSKLTAAWINEGFEKLVQIAASTSNHLTLLKAEPSFVGKSLYVRLSFDTQDAMGMNMATIAAEAISQLLEQECAVRCVSLAGNMDIDKKPAWLNFISGRGRRVWVEVTIPKTVVTEVLKTTPKALYEVIEQKCHIGSALAGSLGFNAHFANIIAAIFLATGQDLGHIVEGSMGITDAELTPDEDIYISVYLPSLLIGTIGGGTQLPSQQEARQLMGVANQGDMVKFASLIGVAVLAGEISLLASQAEGSLVRAHKKHGRNGKGN